MLRIERALTSSSRRDFILCLCILLFIGLVGSYLLFAEYQQQYRYTQLRNTQLQQQIVTLRHKISTLPTEIPPTTVAVAPPAFSMIEILKKSGGRLVHWQPGEPMARLELLLDWEKVSCFFNHLAFYRGVNLSSLKINGTSDPMILSLTIEFSDENK